MSTTSQQSTTFSNSSVQKTNNSSLNPSSDERVEGIHWIYDPYQTDDKHLTPAYSTPQITRASSQRIANSMTSSVRSVFHTSDSYVPASTNNTPLYHTQPIAKLPLSNPSTPKSTLTSQLTLPLASSSQSKNVIISQLISSNEPCAHYSSTITPQMETLLSPAIESLLSNEIYINDTQTRLALLSSKILSYQYQMDEAKMVFPSIVMKLYNATELDTSLQLLHQHANPTSLLPHGQTGGINCTNSGATLPLSESNTNLNLDMHSTHVQSLNSELDEQVVGQSWLEDHK